MQYVVPPVYVFISLSNWGWVAWCAIGDEYWSLGKGLDGLFGNTATVVGVVVRQVPRPRRQTMHRAAVLAGVAA